MNEYIVYTAFLLYSCYLTFSVYRELRSWNNSVKLYGHFPLKVCLLTAKSASRSSNGTRLLSSLLLSIPIASFIIYSPREFLPTWVIILPVFLYLILILLFFATPPSVLLLGSSQWQTVRLMARIERGIFPYRIVAFLDDRSADPITTSWFNHTKFEISNLRIHGTEGIEHWRKTVFYLLREIPQIVLDTRISPLYLSPLHSVVEESRFVLSEKLTQKVTFIMMDDGTTPSIDIISTNTDKSKISTFTPQQVVGELRKRGMKHTKSPNDLPIMAPIVAKKISDKVQRAGKIIDYFGQTIFSARNNYHNTEFFNDAEEIYTRLVNGPGTLTELDNDMDKIQSFIKKWRDDGTDWVHLVVAIAEKVRQAIGDLQIEIDAAPDGLVNEKQAKFY